MKKIWLLIFSLSLLCVGAGNVYGLTITIDDSSAPGNNSYWGGRLNTAEHPTNMDVLGGSHYDFSKMEITFSGNMMKVEIFGDFSDTENQSGDLYLSSTGWKVSGTGPHYETDTFTKDEGWDYVVSAVPNGVFMLDPLAFTSGNLIMTTAGGRSEQGYQGGQGGSAIVPVNTNYGWSSSPTTSLYFEFDYTKLGSLGPDSFGVHFTQSCGNDVIEGGTPKVPEPSSLVLLLGGLVGLGIKMRKKIF